MASTRLDIRLDEGVKAKAEKAAALLGHKSLTDYMVKLMDENASQVIADFETITVENDIFDQFLDACSKANRPNKALGNAAQYTKDEGF